MRHLPSIPRVFIASSSEGKKIAEKLGKRLARGGKCTPTVWTKAFKSSRTTMEQLLTMVHTYDFAIAVLTGDTESKREGREIKKTPSDNVILELGLFFGVLGVDRSLYIRVGSRVGMPEDIDGGNYIPVDISDPYVPVDLTEAASAVEKQIETFGVRYGDFGICIPASTKDDEEFNQSLKFCLLSELNEKGIKLLDLGPRNETGDIQSDFRMAIERVLKLPLKPRYLLILWPLIEERRNRSFILKTLEGLAKEGCRVGFINEFPDISASKYPCLCSSRVFIRGNAEDSTSHVVHYIRDELRPVHYILLLNADQKYRTAKERKEKYQKKLNGLGMGKIDSIDINSWEESEAREKVEARLMKFCGKRQYDLIIAANDRMALGAETALMSGPKEMVEGYSGTRIIGFDGLASAKRSIDAAVGRLIATISVTPRMYAEAAVQQLINFAGAKRTVEIPVSPNCLYKRHDFTPFDQKPKKRPHEAPPSL